MDDRKNKEEMTEFIKQVFLADEVADSEDFPEQGGRYAHWDLSCVTGTGRRVIFELKERLNYRSDDFTDIMCEALKAAEFSRLSAEDGVMGILINSYGDGTAYMNDMAAGKVETHECSDSTYFRGMGSEKRMKQTWHCEKKWGFKKNEDGRWERIK